QVSAGLDMLAAAAEVRPDGVEWEPSERQLTFGAYVSNRVVWTVSDPDGKVIDGAPVQRPPQAELDGPLWKFRRRWVQPPEPTDAKPAEKPAEKADRVYPRLLISFGISLDPVNSPLLATLRWLPGTLAALSLVVWTLALIAGRWVCRRALAPVRRMAEASGVI